MRFGLCGRSASPALIFMHPIIVSAIAAVNQILSDFRGKIHLIILFSQFRHGSMSALLRGVGKVPENPHATCHHERSNHECKELDNRNRRGRTGRIRHSSPRRHLVQGRRHHAPRLLGRPELLVDVVHVCESCDVLVFNHRCQHSIRAHSRRHRHDRQML